MRASLPLPSRRELRLASGLVLVGYIALHLANHALGLVSLAVAERGLALAVRVWQSLPGSVLLYGAFAVHLALALESIHARRTLRMAPADLARVFLGLGIPTLLIGHAVGTRLAWELYGESPAYARVIGSLLAIDGQGRQLALLVPGWLHGCIGVHFAFSRRPLYQRLKPVLFAAALLLPVLGALGFLSMAREMQTTAAVRAVAQAAPHGALASAREGALATYFAACTLVFLARAARGWRERRAGALVRIRYPQRSVQVPRGWSVLEASRGHHLPHLAVCGGRARCSTCRVQVVDGESACPPPDEIEAATLRRIRAAPDVRLACQLRPRGDVAVVPLLAAPGASPRPAPAHGVEKELALVCIEWRDFATLAHALLPQDEVFLATRFRRAVQAVALQHAAVACNVSGERVTLAFGLACDAREGCRQALAAARAAERSLAALAGLCARQFGARPEFALCAHVGIAALGETEDEPQHPPAAAGPAVREAQHLARAGAQAGARLVISLALLRQAGAEAWARSRPGARALASAGGAEALSLPSLEDVDQMLAS